MLEFEENEDMEDWSYNGTFLNDDNIDDNFSKVEVIREWQHRQKQNNEYETQVEVPIDN